MGCKEGSVGERWMHLAQGASFPHIPQLYLHVVETLETMDLSVLIPCQRVENNFLPMTRSSWFYSGSLHCVVEFDPLDVLSLT